MNFLKATERCDKHKIVVPSIMKNEIRAIIRKMKSGRTTGIEYVNPSQPFFSHVMRREKLEYHVITGMVKGKRTRGKQHGMIFNGLTKWVNVGHMTDALKATRDPDVWKNIITYAKDQEIIFNSKLR